MWRIETTTDGKYVGEVFAVHESEIEFADGTKFYPDKVIIVGDTLIAYNYNFSIISRME